MRNFFEYYESLSGAKRQAFRKRIVKTCFIEPPTWYSWMKRRSIPKASQKLIALELGEPMEELFPDQESDLNE